MTIRHKIEAFPDLAGFGEEAVQAGEALAEARVNVADLEALVRQLSSPAALAEAQRIEKSIDDEAVRQTGEAIWDGPSPVRKLEADRRTAEARLRLALEAETEADERLFAAVAASTDRAALAADRALEDAIEAHRAALAAAEATRSAMLAAESDRRWVDGVVGAVEYLDGRSDRHETSRPEFVFPVRPAARPHLRVGSRVIHASNQHGVDFAAGIAAAREETELVSLRPDHGPEVASPDTPAGERMFDSDVPKPRRQRIGSGR